MGRRRRRWSRCFDRDLRDRGGVGCEAAANFRQPGVQLPIGDSGLNSDRIAADPGVDTVDRGEFRLLDAGRRAGVIGVVAHVRVAEIIGVDVLLADHQRVAESIGNIREGNVAVPARDPYTPRGLIIRIVVGIAGYLGVPDLLHTV